MLAKIKDSIIDITSNKWTKVFTFQNFILLSTEEPGCKVISQDNERGKENFII